MADKFVYSSEPRSVNGSRRQQSAGRYREDDSSNIMFDRRVVRGNTYAAQVLTANAQEQMDRQRLTDEKKRKRQMRDSRGNQIYPPGTPPPVPGRSHIDVQTENFLEELTDKVPEVDEETQTDAFMDRPPSPLFIPSKTGVDKDTQIEDGDLFDFNLEVAPILEVLVGKTLEVSMMELMEEEELAAIRAHQEEFEQTRNAELAEVQRLEAEAKRKFMEKQRRLKEEKKRAEQRSELEEKIAARSFAKNYLADMHSNVFSTLMDSGHFYDPLKREVDNQFMPWLFEQVTDHVEQLHVARQVTESLVKTSLELAMTIKEAADADRAEKLRLIELAKEEARVKAEEEARKLAEEEAKRKAEEEDDY